MLSLKNITKKYYVGDSEIDALRGVSIDFRKNEFVSILGPSGCGKTTLLNIIGGLDSYTDGDLAILGRSTKSFASGDWDSYRNHSIGFVFQSYNLIPHQTILSNVELALTLSGVSKHERKRRAVEALEKVGLGDQIKKKPNQLSGGQMQRVAIARALVNDPEILLADEPTGALDSETSVQIMEILKSIAEDKLVIMVTHNPELADKYSTRIVRLLDGKIVDDSMPYTDESVYDEKDPKKKKKAEKNKYTKTSMSLFTALSLSLNNLLTKKARTVMISFAGSIGIIGIALILSLSNGIQAYIDAVQKDTLSSYPIQIMSETVDMNSLVTALSGENQSGEKTEREDGRVYQNTIMYEMMNTMMSTSTAKNNLEPFMDFIESDESGVREHVSAISYGYNIKPTVYTKNDDGVIQQINPSTVMDTFYGEESSMSGVYQSMSSESGAYEIWQEILPGENGENINQLIHDQYDVIYGEWPNEYNEVMLFIDSRNELNDMVLYSLGLKDSEELDDIMKAVLNGEELPVDDTSWTYDELCNLEFTLILPTDIYQKGENGMWLDMSENETYMSYVVNKGIPLKITGIARPNDSAIATAMTGAVGYTKALTDYLIDKSAKSEIIIQQISNEEITSDNNPYDSENVIGSKFSEVDVFTGLVFEEYADDSEELSQADKASKFLNFVSNHNAESKADLYTAIVTTPSETQISGMMEQYMAQLNNREAIEQNIVQYYSSEAGVAEDEIIAYLDTLTDDELNEMIKKSLREEIIKSYAAEIEKQLAVMTEDQLAAALDAQLSGADEATLASYHDTYMPAEYSEATYDENCELLQVVDPEKPSYINIFAYSFEAKEEIAAIIEQYNDSVVTETDKISYTDIVAVMMSSVSTIIDAISYVLIAFVAISLVVSSIMIGIITYISVLERTKEIGILRAIGASKRDISRVFNAEALILGFASGLFGISLTILLNIPITFIIRKLSGISALATSLPTVGAILLVIISMLLTYFAGLIPSKIAAKKDPVVALRTE